MLPGTLAFRRLWLLLSWFHLLLFALEIVLIVVSEFLDHWPLPFVASVFVGVDMAAGLCAFEWDEPIVPGADLPNVIKLGSETYDRGDIIVDGTKVKARGCADS